MNSKGVTPKECRFLEIKRKNNMKIYCMRFNSLSDIQFFLADNPDINKEVFFDIKSVSAKESFAGEPLEKAIKYCVGTYEKNYSQFLELAHMLESANTAYANNRRTETSFVGQRPNVPAYIAGAPKTMYRTSKLNAKKSIDVLMNVTYEHTTTEKQIEHRGIIALNLIRLLERNGYIVNFRLFEVSKLHNEVFLCEVVLKKQGETLDKRLCYYPMCGKEFVRRVLTRIKESMPFEENWGISYGTILNATYAKTILEICNAGINENAIYIGSPNEMNIRGVDLFEDADAFVTTLGIDDKINIPKYKEISKNGMNQVHT